MLNLEAPDIVDDHGELTGFDGSCEEGVDTSDDGVASEVNGGVGVIVKFEELRPGKLNLADRDRSGRQGTDCRDQKKRKFDPINHSRFVIARVSRVNGKVLSVDDGELKFGA